MGVADLGVVADDAHNVGLMALVVDGVAHGLAVDGQAFIVPAPGLRRGRLWSRSTLAEPGRAGPGRPG